MPDPALYQAEVFRHEDDRARMLRSPELQETLDRLFYYRWHPPHILSDQELSDEIHSIVKQLPVGEQPATVMRPRYGTLRDEQSRRARIDSDATNSPLPTGPGHLTTLGKGGGHA